MKYPLRYIFSFCSNGNFSTFRVPNQTRFSIFSHTDSQAITLIYKSVLAKRLINVTRLSDFRLQLVMCLRLVQF